MIFLMQYGFRRQKAYLADRNDHGEHMSLRIPFGHDNFRVHPSNRDGERIA